MTDDQGHRCICEFNLEESGLTVGHGKGHLHTNARLDNVPAQLHGDITEEHLKGHDDIIKGNGVCGTEMTWFRLYLHSL